MPRYDDNTIEEVRSRSDIVEVISGYVRLQKKGGTYFGLCPFHNEKTGSFSVDSRKQMFYCFGCHKGGNVFTFLMEYENFTFQEALSTLAERAGVKLPEVQTSNEAYQREKEKKDQLLEICREAGLYYIKLLGDRRGEHALRYFRGRGLSDETIRRFGLGYSSQQSDDLYKYLKSKGYSDEILSESGLITIKEKGTYDKFWNRAMFPIIDTVGGKDRIIAFGGRVMGEGEPKYLNSPETPIFIKNKTLYGLNIARKSRRKGLILCEGYMDVITMHQAGFDNTIAALGTAFTENHADKIIPMSEGVIYLCFDSDGAGQDAVLRAIPILERTYARKREMESAKERAGHGSGRLPDRLSLKVISMKPYKDPDEFIKALGAEAFEERINKATNSFIFELDCQRAKYDSTDPSDNAAFEKKVASMLVARFPQAMERENYLRAAASRFSISSELLSRAVADIARAEGLMNTAPKVEEELEETDAPKEIVPSAMRQQKRDKNDAVLMRQRLLLTRMTEDATLYPVISKYVGCECYQDGLYRQIADEIYSTLKEGRTVNPAGLISKLPQDEQQEAAEVFFAKVTEEENSAADKQAIREAMMYVRKQYAKDHPATTLDEIKKEKGLQEEIKRLQF